eukprot:568058-Prorocentrum_minimum.AAC.1
MDQSDAGSAGIFSQWTNQGRGYLPVAVTKTGTTMSRSRCTISFVLNASCTVSASVFTGMCTESFSWRPQSDLLPSLLDANKPLLSRLTTGAQAEGINSPAEGVNSPTEGVDLPSERPLGEPKVHILRAVDEVEVLKQLFLRADRKVVLGKIYNIGGKES